MWRGRDPGHPGPRGEGGRRMQRGEGEAGGARWEGRGSVCSQGGGGGLCPVECQLIISLLLTPYVEFFMLSFTSRLNTDKF